MPSDIRESDRAFADRETKTRIEGSTERSATPTDQTAISVGDEHGPGGRDDARNDRGGRNDGGDRIDERLRAVERALTGSDSTVADIEDSAAATAERREIESRLGDLEARVEELEAATQALRGYAGSIRAVNREVERRADLALARAGSGGTRTVDPEDVNARDAGSGGLTAEDLDSKDGEMRDERLEERGLQGSDLTAESTPDPVDEVPSESALDAAVPSDRSRGTAGKIEDVERDETHGTDRATDDRSWRTETLARLRESL
ncbi:DUF7310 family coiled-coil domain-containing protein [Halorubrum trueperi]|uniref:DUF7310 domain-containing protein n=1 Tax=Halorubrum trueperi TaxID=2004704 RepID=A0ABD5UDH3_9EURY